MRERSGSRSFPEVKEATFWVHAKPRSRKNRIVGWSPEGYLEIQVRAVPEGGAANRDCIQEIARALGVPQNQVMLEKGMAGRHKKFRVLGRSREEVRLRLQLRLSPSSR